LAILLVWVVGGVADNGGWVLCGLQFSEQWNVGLCSSEYFVWNSSVKQVDHICAVRVLSEIWWWSAMWGCTFKKNNRSVAWDWIRTG
jgi:hypothetical protein